MKNVITKFGKKYVLLYAEGTKAKEFNTKKEAEQELKRLANMKW